MVKIVYAVCECCGRCLTELRYDNAAKRNATENFVTCDDCVKKRSRLKSGETYILADSPPGQWPPAMPYWRKSSTE